MASAESPSSSSPPSSLRPPGIATIATASKRYTPRRPQPGPCRSRHTDSHTGAPRPAPNGTQRLSPGDSIGTSPRSMPTSVLDRKRPLGTLCLQLRSREGTATSSSPASPLLWEAPAPSDRNSQHTTPTSKTVRCRSRGLLLGDPILSFRRVPRKESSGRADPPQATPVRWRVPRPAPRQ